jgi:hypothetical protein
MHPFCSETLKGRDNLGHLGIDGKIIQKTDRTVSDPRVRSTATNT